MSNTEKTHPDTVHVRSHTAPLTGAFWWIVADNDSGLQVVGTEFYSDKEDAEQEAERINAIRPIDQLIAAAIESLPDKLELVYVNYDDKLSDDQIKALLDGDEEKVWESLNEFESESRWHSVQECWNETLRGFNDDEAERLREDDNAFDEFREAAEERDESDWFKQLVRNTGSIMVRYYLDHDVAPDSWAMSDEEVEDEARAIAEAAGIDYHQNVANLRSLVVEASYGGSLVVLHNSDLDDVLSVKDGGKVIFTDPNLLVYDGLNGSGHDEQVVGTVTVTVDDNRPLRHDAGRYSWSDDIAGVIHFAFQTKAEFIPKQDNK